MPDNIQAPLNPNDAKARAAADKAYRKASRPWFKKKRFIIPLILVVIMVFASALNGGGDESADSAPAGSEESNQQAADGNQNAAAEEAPAEEAAPAFPGAEKSDVIGQGGDALTLGDIAVTSSALFDGDATFGATLCTSASVQNNSDKTIDFNLFDWKLQSPNGTILNATVAGSNNMLSSGQVAPGGTASGDVCFDSKSGEPGQYVVLYEPILSFFSDRAAWLNNR